MDRQREQLRFLPPLLLILAGVLAYWNSFDGVFVYDDLDSVRDNPHIRVLWPLSEAMSLPRLSSAQAVDGRPLLSLSLALNHALFGPEPWGYHLVNLIVHIAAGLLLFGIVRRTLGLPRFREQYTRRGTWLALVVALIWLVHPLQTESVTYIVQRAESLMGMFLLLTLYASLRGFTSENSEFRIQNSGEEDPPLAPPGRGTGDRTSNIEHRTPNIELVLRCWKFSVRCSMFSYRWHILAILACALGMGVKQTMFSAPLLVLLYDGVFISPSLRVALKKRWRFYAALCATWLIVFGIIAASWKESTADFVKISPVRYLLTQPLVLLYYLRLAFWPSPLVLEYGWPLEDQWPRIVFPGLVILGMLFVMFRGIRRHSWYGFVLAWFFLILAPTSSIAPMRQAIFEHRMYLSLAAVIMLAVVGAVYALRKSITDPGRRALLGICVVTALVFVLGYRTHERNKDYHTAIGIWQDDVAHRPRNALAHLNLGNAVQAAGRPREAIRHYQQALRLNPRYAEAHFNWGVALEAAGQVEQALGQYQQALRIDPRYADAHNNLGHALQALGRSQEAVEHCREALRIKPGLPDAHFNLGNALQALGRSRDAIEHYRKALNSRPDYAEAQLGWGNVLLTAGRPREAIERYREALRLKPNYAEAHYHWGMALDAQRRPQDAMTHYRQAVRIKPDFAEAHLNLGNAALALGRPREAILHYRQALRIRPDYSPARNNLGIARQLISDGQRD